MLLCHLHLASSRNRWLCVFPPPSPAQSSTYLKYARTTSPTPNTHQEIRAVRKHSVDSTQTRLPQGDPPTIPVLRPTYVTMCMQAGLSISPEICSVSNKIKCSLTRFWGYIYTLKLARVFYEPRMYYQAVDDRGFFFFFFFSSGIPF